MVVVWVVSFVLGAAVVVATHHDADELVREQNELLRRLVAVHAENTELVTQNCEVMTAMDQSCQETLEDLAERLGIKDQVDNLVETAVWKKLRAHGTGKGGG